MVRKVLVIGGLLAGLLLGCDRNLPGAASPIPAQPVPTVSAIAPPTPSAVARIAQESTARFRLYKTQNIWTLLLLDTRTGRLWQANYSINAKGMRAVTTVSDKKLGDGVDGRFSLTLTDNIWTSILLDNKDGRTWQCQFSTDDDHRFCIPLSSNSLAMIEELESDQEEAKDTQ